METVTSGQADDADLIEATDRFVDFDELTNLELLAVALQDAMDARNAGLIIGPAVDRARLERANRRAIHADICAVLGKNWVQYTGGAA